MLKLISPQPSIRPPSFAQWAWQYPCNVAEFRPDTDQLIVIIDDEQTYDPSEMQLRPHLNGTTEVLLAGQMIGAVPSDAIEDVSDLVVMRMSDAYGTVIGPAAE